MRENEFLDWVRQNTPPHSAVPLGIGDDMAAVVLSPEAAADDHTALALLKVDQVLDGVHFDLSIHAPAAVGRKAVNRCLSDCAAMACQPAAVMLAVALPAGVSMKVARELYRGCRDAAAVFDCPIVGGDTAIWGDAAGRLVITVAALGRTDMLPLTRAGAQPGDAICVTGALGGSLRPDGGGRHLTFTPRILLAQALARTVPIHAMMDLSDGLAMDLPRLCARSGVGAAVEARRVPIHPDAQALAAGNRAAALRHALADGEDYELLLTVAEADVARIIGAEAGPGGSLAPPHAAPVSRIGTITAGRAVVLVDEHNRRAPGRRAAGNTAHADSVCERVRIRAATVRDHCGSGRGCGALPYGRGSARATSHSRADSRAPGTLYSGA